MRDQPRIDLKPGIYLGAAISAVCFLLPFVNQIVLPAYLLGPLAGAWLENRRRRASLSFQQGARLGFYSTFYGALGAIEIDRVASEFLREQLWRWQNIYRLPPVLASKGFDASSTAGWYALMGEIAIIAIFSGMLGAPAGLIGVKLFRRHENS